ncbi:unnamed protein product [Moneuplotes crassus]|uniref:Cyclin-like domain-containing protein n=1 Tax=Euplotes crassus TaxID=5936 RepID=A0AAD1Y697_EUPCR|nr:unnamed protein product [Moneuplotes crassus]
MINLYNDFIEKKNLEFGKMSYDLRSPPSLDTRAMAAHDQRKNALKAARLNRSDEIQLETIREKRFRMRNWRYLKAEHPKLHEEKGYCSRNRGDGQLKFNCKQDLFQNHSQDLKERNLKTMNKSRTEKKSHPHKSYQNAIGKIRLFRDLKKVPGSRRAIKNGRVLHEISGSYFCEKQKLHKPNQIKNGSMHKRKIKNYKLKDIRQNEKKQIKKKSTKKSKAQRKLRKISFNDETNLNKLNLAQQNFINTGSEERVKGNLKQRRSIKAIITSRCRENLDRQPLVPKPCLKNINKEVEREVITEIKHIADTSMEQEKPYCYIPSIPQALGRDLSINSDAKMESEEIPQQKIFKAIKNSFWSFQKNKRLEKTHCPLQVEYMKNYGERLLEKYLLREKDFGDPFLGHNIPKHLRCKTARWVRKICITMKIKNNSPRVFHLAMHIFDYFFWMKQEIENFTDQHLHLIAVVSIFMASKYEEIEPLKLDSVYKSIGFKEFTKKEIIYTERAILEKISTLSFVTAYDFLALITENLQTFARDEEMILREFIQESGKELEECIIHPHLSQFKPSILCIICLNRTLDDFAKNTMTTKDCGKENINPFVQNFEQISSIEYLNHKAPFSRASSNKRLNEELRIRAQTNCAILEAKKVQTSPFSLKRKLVRRWRNQISNLEEYGMKMPVIQSVI